MGHPIIIITKDMILGKGSNTKKATCFAISLIILSSIVTNILILNVSGYTTHCEC